MTIQIITALDSKNQSTVNSMYAADRNYHRFVNLGDEMEANEDGTIKAEREMVANAKYQEKAFDRAEAFKAKLTKKELTNAERQYLAIHGYSLV